MSGSIANWSARHAHALISTAGHLARHGMATTLTVSVMALALAVPLALNVLVRNVRGVSGDFSEAIGLSVYLKPEISEQRARQLASSARALPGIASVTLISAAQAFDEFRRQSGFGAALDALTDNPLPNLLEIHPSPAASSPARLEFWRNYFAAWPAVDSVQLDRDWALRFNALIELARALLLVSAALLAAAVIAVVGNTIRLEIHSRRTEIEVTKLVGGSNAFVRRPFLYAGALYGLAAALVGWGIVALTRLMVAAQAGRLAAAYGSQFTLQGPSARELAVLLAVGAALGWLGAAVASASQLARLEPSVA